MVKTVMAIGVAFGADNGDNSALKVMSAEFSPPSFRHEFCYSVQYEVVNAWWIGFAGGSLGSLASEVSTLYGLRSDPNLVTTDANDFQNAQVSSSLDQFYALKNSALSGAATVGITLGLNRNATTADWMRANAAPSAWVAPWARKP